VPEPGRARALASVSSGTGAGVAIAAPLALLVGTWRLSWVAFAAVAALTTLVAARVVPAATAGAPGRRRLPSPAGARPLLAAATLVGLGAAVPWTWAVDRVAGAGGLGTGDAQALLVVVGVASLAGMLAGDLAQRVGLRTGAMLCGALLAAALIALALAPSRVAAAVVAAVLFGAAYNGLVAIQGLWSSRVYRQEPARGLAAVMSAMGVGFLLGPPLTSLLVQRSAFLVAAALLAAAGWMGSAAPAAAQRA
jgi:predicted MFS family arabinose efflux permease